MDIFIFNVCRWGDCLVMVASQEVREKAILGLDCDPNVPLSDIQYCLLEHIGQARYNGRMQKYISSNFFKVESRTTFHHLKILRKAHLVTMQVKYSTQAYSLSGQFFITMAAHIIHCDRSVDNL